MNKSGHLATGVLAGSAYLYFVDTVQPTLQGISAAALMVVCAAAGSIAPDLDHKTSTASRMISPFSSRTRRSLRWGGFLGICIGVVLFLLNWLQMRQGLPPIVSDIEGLVLPEALRSFPIWLAAGVLLIALSKLRSLILIVAGALVLYAYYAYQLHWLFIFIGLTLLIMPIVKHRGVIHTPEFAAVLTWGVYSIIADSPWYIIAIGIGIVIGWWVHLAGDIFGSDGIHSLFAPFLKIALHLFQNGGFVEKTIARLSWIASFVLWILWLMG